MKLVRSISILFWICAICAGKSPFEERRVFTKLVEEMNKNSKFESSVNIQKEAMYGLTFIEFSKHFHEIWELSPFYELVRYWVLDTAMSRWQIEQTVDKVIQFDLNRLFKEFIQFEGKSDNLLEATPETYSNYDLKDLQWKGSRYCILLSNIRRVDWILDTCQNSKAVSEKHEMLDKTIQKFYQVIDGLIKKITEEKKSVSKQGSDKAIELLKGIRSFFDKNVEEVMAERDADWNDLQPFFEYGLSARRNVLKDRFNKLFSVLQDLNDYHLNEINECFEEITMIFRLISQPSVSEALKASAREVQIHMFNELFKLQDAVFTRYNQVELSLDSFKYATTKQYIRLLEIILETNPDYVETNQILDLFYQAAQKIRAKVELVPSSNCNIHQLTKLLPDLKFVNKMDYSQTILKSENALSVFMVCYFSTTTSEEEFKQTVKTWSLSAMMYIYFSLKSIDDATIKQFQPASEFLAKSKLLPLNFEIMEAYVSAVIKFVFYRKIAKAAASKLFLLGLISFLNKRTKVMIEKSSIKKYSFLALIVYLEDPARDYCALYQYIDESQYAEIERFIGMREFSKLPECLNFISTNSISLKSSLDHPEKPTKLDIDMQLQEKDDKRNTIIVEIDFIDETHYSVSGRMVGKDNDSKSEFIKKLKESHSLCKPEDFDLSKCLADPINKIRL